MVSLSAMTSLTIIILSYNAKNLLSSCVNSLFTFYREELTSGAIELLIFDNNSTDGSQAYIKEHAKKEPSMKAIFNTQNIGFTKGNNTASQKAKGEYLLFLNSDTEVLDNGFLKMVDYLRQHKHIGVLGGKMQNEDGSNQPSAGRFLNLVSVLFMLLGAEKIGLLRFCPSTITQVDWVSGGFMMIKKDLFEQYGKFDENIFMYMEDMELCFRIKKFGKSVYFYPAACILHKGYGSSNRSFAIEHIYKGLLYFYKKHSNYIQYTVVKTLLVSKACMAIALGMATKDSYLTSTYKKALSVSI